MTKIGNPNDGMHNKYGYSDPTAAIRNESADKIRFKKLLKAIFQLCDLSGFDIRGRIVLVDRRTGKVWK